MTAICDSRSGPARDAASQRVVFRVTGQNPECRHEASGHRLWGRWEMHGRRALEGFVVERRRNVMLPHLRHEAARDVNYGSG